MSAEGVCAVPGTVAACIVCRNEADKLGPCLESVAWADEVIVLDLESDDGSGELAETLGARVVRREPVPIVEMVRNELAAMTSTAWVLVLDPDERLSAGAAEELRKVAGDDSVDAVVIPRTNFDLGHAPSHWSQRFEPQLRMYRPDRLDWPERPNALPDVDEHRLHRLPSEDGFVIVHERSRSIAEVLDRSIRYAPVQAKAMLDAGQDTSARAMATALWREVDTKLLGPRAWRDGLPGLLRSVILVQFKIHVWIELWQQAGARRTERDDRFIRAIGWPLEAVRAASRAASVALRLWRRVGARRR